MQKPSLILALLCLCQVTQAQEKTTPYELGSTLVTVNSLYKNDYGAFGRKPVEFANGLFFRYTTNRIGIRAHIAYSETTVIYDFPIMYSTSSIQQSKDLRLGLGAQYSLMRTKEWLYSYIDFAYRNVYSSQHYYGDIFSLGNNQVSNSNAIDCSVGIGLKKKVFKNIYLSPEFGFYSSSASVHHTITYTPGYSDQFKWIETNITTVCKLHCTVKF